MTRGLRAPVQRIVGVLLVFLSLGFVPPLLFAVAAGDGTGHAFALSFSVVALLGVLLYWPVRKGHRELRIRDGFLVVVVCWLAVCLAGALPFVLILDAGLVDALFESTSGLTTTGATVLSGLDHMPRSLLWYRQQLQWMGGMGIIVLAVAILPMLRVGGMQVYKAEITGPVKETRLTPRVARTAKALWLIYLGLTLACAVAYWAGGMSLFDAISHSFSTVATAGFSTHDASIAHFDSALIEWLVVFFLFVSSMNFGLHFLALRRASAEVYFRDPELRLFVTLLLLVSMLVTLLLWRHAVYTHVGTALRHAVFQTVSFMSTAGLVSAEVALWPGTLPLLLLLISALGGCAGATTGGFKIIRVYLLGKQGVRELRRLIHPRAVVPLKLGQRTLDPEVANAVWGYVALYILCVVVLTLVVAGLEADLVTAGSVVFSSINNLGPALGQAAANYAELGSASKLVASFAMLLGRLELFTILVLFVPDYWRS